MDGFKFAVDQRVRTVDTHIEGHISTLAIERDGVRSVLLVYFDRGNVQQRIWLPEGQLEAIPADEKKMGTGPL